jgi:hypothetical protein
MCMRGSPYTAEDWPTGDTIDCMSDEPCTLGNILCFVSVEGEIKWTLVLKAKPFSALPGKVL